MAASSGLFRFLHRWTALVPEARGDVPLEPIAHLLEDRDRQLEDHLDRVLGGPQQPGMFQQVDAAVVATNGAGNATVTMPWAFPVANLVVVCTNQNANAAPGVLIEVTARTLTTFTIYASTAVATPYVGALTVGYVAVGY